MTDPRATKIDELEALFARVGARGWLCVSELTGDGRVELGADAPVAVASVVKIVIALAFAREAAEGRVDPRARVEVPAALRVGGTGTAGFRDPVTLSLRDLARSMMTVSDNAATDVVMDAAGPEAIAAVLERLGLVGTHVRGGMMWGHRRAMDELGLVTPEDLDAQVERADAATIRRLAWIDPARANASTARDIAALLEAIWTDRAGPPEACAFVRGLMAEQVSRQRLASGFALPGVRVAAKSGTLPSVRNEAGVIEYPDGRRYAAAVFTRADSVDEHRPDVDAAIGAAARRAVDHLRGER